MIDRKLTPEEILTRIDQIGGRLTDLHLHYLEESRRYGTMLEELAEIRALVVAGNDTAINRRVAELIAESVQPTPPAPASLETPPGEPVKPDPYLVDRMNGKREKPSEPIRKHGRPGYRQVG